MTDEYKKGLITGLAMQPLYVSTEKVSSDINNEIGILADVYGTTGTDMGIIVPVILTPAEV